MTILLLDLYFKIKSWIYRGILGVLVKNSLRPRLEGENGMEWNGMYLSKGKEWKRKEWNEMELSNLGWMF